MGAGLVKISDIFGCDAPQMTFAQNEHVVQAFAAQTAQKTLAKRIRAWRFHRSFQQFDIRPIDHLLKLVAKLLVVISNQKAWSLTKRRGFAQLLGP